MQIECLKFNIAIAPMNDFILPFRESNSTGKRGLLWLALPSANGFPVEVLTALHTKGDAEDSTFLLTDVLLFKFCCTF